jgi:hypothetical protein
MSSSGSDRDPIEQLAEEFLARYRRGEQPALTEYAERYPQHADEIRRLFPALLKMEQLKPPSAEETGPHDPRTSRTSGPKLDQLGDYRILREVGRGGMGIVYEAEQQSLGRHVALKVLPRHTLLDGRQLGRFEREARAAARLHHSNIVPVYGVGEQDGLHYYVMQFIQGRAVYTGPGPGPSGGRTAAASAGEASGRGGHRHAGAGAGGRAGGARVGLFRGAGVAHGRVYPWQG